MDSHRLAARAQLARRGPMKLATYPQHLHPSPSVA